MDAEKLNQALYDKMAAEQETFRSWLLEQPPEEILNHTYTYTMREDILMAMEFLELSAPQAQALLESPAPLADIFKDFQDMETGHMDNIQECIEERADKLLETRQREPVPIYRHDGNYALEHGELEQFRASLKENIACRDAIENAIREGFDGMYLSGDAAKGVLSAFGPERVSYVLAATLQEKSHDGRFSRNNQEWAASVPNYDTDRLRMSYLLNSHSAVLDGFVSQARKEMQSAREQPEKKLSIRAQLASAKEAQAKQPAAQQLRKDKEAR